MVMTREVREEIENAVKQAVSTSIKSDSFIKTISNVVTAAVIKTMESKISKLEKTVAALEVEINEMKTENKNKIDDMQDIINDVSLENIKIKEQIDKIDQAGRMQSLRIFNLAEKNKEDTRDEIIKMLNSKMFLNIASSDIQICYRIGRKNEVKPRGIYLKLNNCEIKKSIYSKKKLLKGTGVVIREDLASLRLELLNETISNFSLKQVWTDSGKIYANVDNKIVNIKNKKDLYDLVTSLNL